MKEIATPLRFLIRKVRNRQPKIRQRATRRRSQGSQLHPRVLNAISQKLILGGCGLGRVDESEGAKELESNLYIRIAGHVRELPRQLWSFQQVGLSQANCVFADTRDGIVKSLCDETRVKFSQAVECPQSMNAPHRGRAFLKKSNEEGNGVGAMTLYEQTLSRPPPPDVWARQFLDKLCV